MKRTNKAVSKNDLGAIIREQLQKVPNHPLLTLPASTNDDERKKAGKRKRVNADFEFPFSEVSETPRQNSTRRSSTRNFAEALSDATNAPRRARRAKKSKNSSNADKFKSFKVSAKK